MQVEKKNTQFLLLFCSMYMQNVKILPIEKQFLELLLCCLSPSYKTLHQLLGLFVEIVSVFREWKTV